MQGLGKRSGDEAASPRAGGIRIGPASLAILGMTMTLAACAETRGADRLAVTAGDLPPIQRDYKDRIVRWAQGFYAEPRSLRDTRISDPVLIRDRTGRLLWLVCISAHARARDGDYMGPQNQAFGFAPNFFSAPLDRNRTTLVREDCDAQPLAWRPWPELQQLRGETTRRPRRG